ncbi:uncharacterized protein LOC129719835 [Wyeomyia smithii]|uniref:uncharacterized protein LOC129719835 n=1 Tax=Wyeomyia smithii TaxID=174621 RepID=UPI0024681920|nr:uncharacterized protein LOC129719835 [Wyeomyia smithii]
MASYGNDSQVENNCALCAQPDEHDDMVACDSCHLWHHYSCVKVTASVQDRKWHCPSCEPLCEGRTNKVQEKDSENNFPNSNVLGVQMRSEKSLANSKSSRRSKKLIGESITSSTRVRLELELKAVEEQRLLQEEELAEEMKWKETQRKLEEEFREKVLAIEAKRINEEKRALEQKMADEREYRRQQMAIRKQSAEEKNKLIQQASEYNSSHGSITSSGVSFTKSRDKVKDWLKNTNQQIEGTKQASTSAVKPSADLNQVVPLNRANKKMNTVINSQLPTPNNVVSQHGDVVKPSVSQRVQETQNQTNQLNKPNNYSKETSNISARSRVQDYASEICSAIESENNFDRNNYVDHSQCGPTNSQVEYEASDQQSIQHNPDKIRDRRKDDNLEGPTSRQLATRQVIGKDLPIFSGNSDEWPIWISNFQRSTTSCGFSDDENLIRLQRCLKGPALEAVRSRLLSPAGVPHIIKALQMRYGRPETLIRALTERVCRLPPLKANELESIIEFGLAVDNLVQHLKNVGYQTHLSNPSLLQDLVGKLPVDYRLKWAAFKSEKQDVDLGTFGQFMSNLVELAYNVADDIPCAKSQKSKYRERSFVHTHAETGPSFKNELHSKQTLTGRLPKKPCAVCNAESHRVSECIKFKAMNIDGRLKATDPEQELNQLVRDYITLDDAGVKYPYAPQESDEDRRARIIMESTTRRIDGGFETGLLWKCNNPTFPDSYGMAYKRMCSLERRLSKEPVLYDRFRQQIRDYEVKGYAHKATENEIATTDPAKCWYLPLGIVLNPKKPNKLRLIWDAAATVNGVSLNSTLLKGPDLLTGLPSVMSTFRLYRFALTGDIKEMFHRFVIRTQDRQYLRFLFRDNPDQEPVVYVMDVAIFGASCSPSSAQYIKNVNAKEFEAKFPRAVAAIVHRHYVDDYLDSFGTSEEAIKVGKEVKKIHAYGGFEIRNFLSNDPAIAAQVGEESSAVEKEIRSEKDERIESVLGMKWIPSSDTFTYTVALRDNLKHVLEKSHVPTKREVLRTVMSFFDPLGLISFFLIHGRILMQDIWAEGIGWDDKITDKLRVKWRDWIDLVPQLNDIRIPRCYFLDAVEETYSSLQVHVFVDASRSAYACAVYFRVETPHGPEVQLVNAKSKVAPLKMQTVPRLELRAAVLGSRLLHSVLSMHALPVVKRVLWSDSSTVLAWIRSDQRRYHQYVGFRIGEILTLTDVSEWRKIGSSLNVADDATKWGSGPRISSDNRWFHGPDFLRQPEKCWPGKDEPVAPTNEELLVCNVHCNIQEPLIDTNRFSTWVKLHRSVAYVLRFVKNIKSLKRNKMLDVGYLTQDELMSAEQLLWRQAQREIFASEISILETTMGEPEDRHRILPKSSAIYKLWPFMDKNGVIRKRNRLGNAEWIPYKTKYPVILPSKHPITFLIVDSFHRRFRHCNRETVVNELRQLYEIPKLRSLVTKVSESCIWCKVLRAHPSPPPMAPLPKVRLTPYIRPFTYVGVDYFGPVPVKLARTIVKRWIALFTCLTIRAVHLEVVHSLSKESCVMAIRRFVSRRGAPAEIFSDNGTNFHGANNQLKREIEDRNNHLAATFTNTTTRWNFNPPGAPHMGGAWERMVRSVKTAIGTILEAQRRPDDEILETVIIEAEAMINTRPLTYIPLQSADQEALTPNHFLLGSSDGVKQHTVMPTNYRTTLNSGWKLAQHLSDGIWKRWIKEYLPIISRRSKWFEDVKEIEVGDLVLIVDSTVRNQWIRGKVIKVVKGKDGRIRQALVLTTNGIVRRPVVKLALLDVVREGKPEED